MKRRLFLETLGAVSAAPAPRAVAASAEGVSRYDVVWDTPSVDSLGSMPLGNGETGLNVWVERDGDLLFYIGRADAFSEDHSNLKLGRVRVQLAPNPFAGGQPFHQKLELENACIRIDAGLNGEQVHLKIWVDANQPVIRIEGESATARTACISYETWRPLKLASSASEVVSEGGDVLIDDKADRLLWYHRNESSVWSQRLGEEGLGQLVAGRVADPLLHLTFGGMIRGPGLRRVGPAKLAFEVPASRLDAAIHLHAGQYPAAAQWASAIEAQASRSDRTPLKLAWSAHQEWWRRFWLRSWIRIEGSAIARTISERYAHQRFINACSNRGRYPVMYNGSIFTMDLPAGTPTYFGPLPKAENADYRSWGSLPIMWQNTRHPYWPMLTSGDFDLMRPVFDLCRDALEVCKARARVWHGLDGMLMPESMYLGGVSRFGKKIPQHLVYHRTGMIEMANMMGDYVHHTGDRDFARKTWLPFAAAVVTFFEQHYKQRDERGRMVMSPSGAVETYQPAVNPVTESAGLARLLDQLLASSALDLDGRQKAQWAEMRRIVPEVPWRTVMGRLLLAVADETPAGREICEVPELYAIWPFRRIAPEDHRRLAGARQSFAVRMMSLDGTDDKQAYETGGWLYTAADAAYLCLPRDAARLVEQNFGDGAPWLTGATARPPLPSGHPGQPRFTAFWETRMDFIPDQCHGGASIHALQSMLLQADGKTIYLLPAWPEEWDVQFRLYAPMSTIVEGEYRAGKLRVDRVTPESRRVDIVDLSTPECRVRAIVSTAVADFNYLFGLPPMPDAQWRPAAAREWIARFGDTLRGIAGPFAPADWGGSIARGSTIYLHVIKPAGESLVLPPLPFRVRSCRSLAGNAAKVLRQDASGVLLSFSPGSTSVPDTIVELGVDGDAEALARGIPYAGSLTKGQVVIRSSSADPSPAIDGRWDTAWTPEAGAAPHWLEVDLGSARPIRRAQIHFAEPGGPYKRSISLEFECRDQQGNWTSLWKGTSYSQVWVRAFASVLAQVVRVKTSAAAIRQFDLFEA